MKCIPIFDENFNNQFESRSEKFSKLNLKFCLGKLDSALNFFFHENVLIEDISGSFSLIFLFKKNNFLSWMVLFCSIFPVSLRVH
jgi:hypothetical protein